MLDRIQVPSNDFFDKRMKVYGLANGHFLINHYWISGAVIVFKDRFYMWGV